ncbi:MAG: YicC family protein [Nitrospirae bacterium]|nr:MAG: YicC family protein [Nitrospirota bacterium]TLY43909.1 MAG: YicC family protein [Nitrospirota bacterium]
MRRVLGVQLGGQATTMITSMTGYGRREAVWRGGSVVAELRSVNHRFCEVVIRLPRALSSLEDDFKRRIQRRCTRGRVELAVSLHGGKDSGRTISLDRSLAKQYHRLLGDLKQDLRLGGTIDVALLAGFRDIVSVSDQPVVDRRMTGIVRRLMTGALADLDAMRRREGAALARDAKSRMQVVRQAAASIATRTPLVVQEYFERMKARVEKLVGSGQADSGRLHQEIALYADRCDVTEELTRLESHLAQFTAALNSRGPVGKTLDFLLQEMGREVNTIGSKANDAEISTHVVQIKSELEKVREQVQNIE